MNPELENKLVNDFPKLFRGKDEGIKNNLMCFGCAIGDGWEPIFREACEKLDALDSNIKLVQVKEKFGGLRIYLEHEPEEARVIIREAEKKAIHTCEYCGKPGKTREGGWIKTLCDECNENNK